MPVRRRAAVSQYDIYRCGNGDCGGVYIDRQLLSGSLGGAGEIGHTTIEPDGPLCPCGNQGCLQTLSAGPAMEQHYRKLVRSSDLPVYSDQIIDLQTVKMHDVCAAAEQGDMLAAQVVKTAASYLGISMANLLNTFNPEAFILGGTVPSASLIFCGNGHESHAPAGDAAISFRNRGQDIHFLRTSAVLWVQPTLPSTRTSRYLFFHLVRYDKRTSH